MNTAVHCPRCGTPLALGVAQGLCPRCLLNAGFASNAAGTGGNIEATSAYGKTFVVPTPAELALLFPQFEAIELIGQGGMGAVYKARQPKLDRWVAIKILPRDAAQAPGFADRFTREARALAQLSHPNIVAVYDFGQTDGLYFFVMEYVDGTDLRRLVASHELSPEAALAIVPQVCDALHFAHSEGIVHRDVKPENILVDKKGRVKMADFGLAKLLGREAESGHLTATHQVMGTPRYMAPEQIERPQLVDHRADIYALGVVLYEMLTGELPLGRFAPPSAKVQVDVRLDEVVFRALEKEPERRYQRASEVKSDVERIARPAASSPADLAGRPTGAPNETFVVFNPRLPKIAQWICGYALVISPVLFALSLAGLMVFTLDSNDYMEIAGELFTLPLSSLTVVLLFVGGLRLRGLQRSGVGWLKAGFGLEILWLPVYLALWLVWTAADPTVVAALDKLDKPGNGRDFISLSLVILCYAFDIFAFVWLRRFSRTLPLA
ncbi:MAG TPA: serine/threonine-protein kinase [Pirellulales bacterium]|nr:serine/threonine-protein kinase [Pirellulales bacterium]